MKDLYFRVHLSFNDKDIRKKLENILLAYHESMSEIKDYNETCCHYKEFLTEAYVNQISNLIEVKIIPED